VLLGVNFANKTEPVERKVWPASFRSSLSQASSPHKRSDIRDVL
jgi:hypothetical protein